MVRKLRRIINMIKLNILLLIILISTGCSTSSQSVSVSSTINKADMDTIVSNYTKKFTAKEIILSLMDSATGKIVYVSNLKSATQFTYEAGAVISPLSISLALNSGKVSADDVIDTHNGTLKVNRWSIKDSYKFPTRKVSIKDIVAYSSSVGTVLISDKLSTDELYNGYKMFGLSVPTGYIYRNDTTGIFKATASYGQGLTTTHLQLLKAYSVFNNNGVAVTPHINTKADIEQKRVLRSSVSHDMRAMLIHTVEVGTAHNTKLDNVEIGAKTGTANMVQNGKYTNHYVTSCFGFINTLHHHYTIGVTVVDPIIDNNHYNYASNSAVIVFRDVVKLIK